MPLTTIAGQANARDLNDNFSYLDNQAVKKEELYYIDVKNYGAVGDGITDDTISIRQAIADAETNDTVILDSSVGFLTTDSITIEKAINVIMKSPIILDNINSIPALVIGNESNSSYRKIKSEIKVKRKNKTLWDDENDIGILLINQFSSFYDIQQTEGFTVGVKCLASEGNGFSHVQMKLNDTVNNKIHLLLASKTNGYVNENIFMGGRFTNFGTLPDDADKTGRRAIKIVSEDNTYTINNNNVFIKPCFQNSGGTGIEIAHGTINKVIAARNEGTDYAALFKGESRQNEIQVLYSTEGKEDYINESDNSTNVVSFGRNIDLNESKRTIANFDLTKLWTPFNSNDSYMKSMSIVRLAGGGAIEMVGGSDDEIDSILKPNNGYLELQKHAVGIELSTEHVKNIVVNLDYAQDSDHWVLVRCFDSNGDSLVLEANLGFHIKGGSRAGETFSNVSYGFFRTSTMSENVSFQVSDAVKKIWVGVGRSSTSISKVRSMSILTRDRGPISLDNGHNASNMYDQIAVQSPDRGTWTKGHRIYNASPLSGSNVGWVCTASGSPGTWKAFGTIEV